jgi:nicotinamidase-related amidase
MKKGSPMAATDRRQFLAGTGAASMAALGTAAAMVPTRAAAQSNPSTKANPAMKERFNLNSSVVMLVDHQTGTVNWVKSQPKDQVIGATRALARMAVEYSMPLVLTTTMEDMVGSTIDDLQKLAPEAYAKRFKRGGQLSCWDDPALTAGVKALKRRQIILAGLTTDICAFWAAYDAVKLGYQVMLVADACGSLTAMADQLTFDRLRDEGVTVCGINQAQTELVNNFGTPEGQKAMKINMEEIISRMTK